jgi:DMSO/TMAO reductase YedYZ molybdopterin-dependent catalytic subunit
MAPEPANFLERLLATRAPRPEDFTSPVHDERVVARIGVWIGAAMGICFLTGLISHYQQNPVGWLPLGPDPAWGYRVTQGAHILCGTLMLPLILAKLFSAYPRLFAQPPVRGLLHLVDRLSVGLLIAATVFQIATGLANTAQYYPWKHFGFVGTHFAVAWLAVGALCLHIAFKLPVIQRALGLSPADSEEDGQAAQRRRAFLIGVFTVTAGTALLTAGQTVYPLRRLALLAPRRPDVGPEHVPINRTAKAAGVLTTATDTTWHLHLTGPSGDQYFTRAQLTEMAHRSEELPIACVEGWSANAMWWGVPIRQLVVLAGGGPDSVVHIESLEQKGNYARTQLPAAYARDPRTLLALRINGEELSLDHGYPARIIAPNRPGVLQTKWVNTLTVTS